jgi:hypothetical protein
VGKDLVTVSQLDTKHSVWKSFDDRTFDLDDTVFTGHNSLIYFKFLVLHAHAKTKSIDLGLRVRNTEGQSYGKYPEIGN